MKYLYIILLLCTPFSVLGWTIDILNAWNRSFKGYVPGLSQLPDATLYEYQEDGVTKYGAMLEPLFAKTALDCKPAKNDDEEYQLECIGAYDGILKGDIVIPDFFTKDGVEQIYPVVGIEFNAFNLENMNTVRLPSTVALVSNQSFHSCPNLKELDLSMIRNYDFTQDVVGDCPVLEKIWLSDCPTIISGYYYGNLGADGLKLPALKEIYSPCVTPLKNQVFNFHEITPEGFDNIKLYVKPGCEEVYRADPLWGQFRNILPYDFAARTPLSEVATSDIEFRVYDTRGNLVATSPDFAGRGIYILQEISAGTVKTIKIRK